jgi:maleate isomerase
MLGVAQIKGELPRRGVALLGFHLEAATGIVASACILSLVDILTRIWAASQALVTPYTRDVQDTTIATYAALGFACPAERHPGQFQLRCGG